MLTKRAKTTIHPIKTYALLTHLNNHTMQMHANASRTKKKKRKEKEKSPTPPYKEKRK